MDEATERRAIAQTVEAIARTAGTPPVGWHTRSATSVQHAPPADRARRLPLRLQRLQRRSALCHGDRRRRPMSCCPTPSIPTTCVSSTAAASPSRSDFARYCIDAFDRLYLEGATAPRMLSVGLHPRIIGRPARIGGLEGFLDHALSHDGVWFATRAEIARAWRAGLGLPDWIPRPCPPDYAPGAGT